MTTADQLSVRVVEDWMMLALGLGEIVDDRYYRHDFDSVGSDLGGVGGTAIVVGKQSGYVGFSREAFEDRQAFAPPRRRWADLERDAVERRRLRNRIRQFRTAWRRRGDLIWRARRRLARAIDPYGEADE